MENENYYTEATNLPLSFKLLQFYYRYVGSFFPALSGWIFWKIFSLPKKRKIRKKHQIFLVTAKTQTIAFENYQIQAYHWGEADKKILIVHGWEGMSADFKGIITELTNSGFSVMAIDLPAHGKSSGKHTHLPMIIRLIEKLIAEHGPFYGIVSHSLGAAASSFTSARINGKSNLSKLVLMGLHPVPFAYFEQFRQALKIKDKLFDKCVLYVENKVDVKIREASVHKIASSISANHVLLVHDEKDEVANISRN